MSGPSLGSGLALPWLYRARSAFRGRPLLLKLPVLALGAAFWAVLYFGTKLVLLYLIDAGVAQEFVARRFLGFMFLSLTGFLLLSNLITAVTSFYLSRDLALLRSMPVPLGGLLGLKTVQSITVSSWMVASFMPPVLVGFGVACGAPPAYYAAGLMAFVLFMLVNAGAGIALAHVLVRLLPAARVRDVMLFMGLVFFLGVYYFVRSAVPADGEDPTVLLRRLVLARFDSPFLPSYWITEALVPALVGGPTGLFYHFVLAANGAFSLMLAHLAGKALYRGNLDRLTPSRGPLSGAPAGRAAPARPYPGRRWALIYKDLKVFTRDKAQWSQMLIILALAFVYVYNFKLIPVATLVAAAPYAREVVLLINLLMAGMVLTAVAARFVYTAVSIEGQAFWVIRSSPRGMGRFLIEKFLAGFAIITPLTLAMVVISNLLLGLSPRLMAFSGLTVVLLGLSVCAMAVGMGAIAPKFEYENIASVSVSLGAMGFMVASFTLVTATLALLAWPVVDYYGGGGGYSPGVTVLAVSLALVINLSAACASMALGRRRLSYNSWS